MTDKRGAYRPLAGHRPAIATEDEVITLHRLNGEEMTLNADLILTIEATPDTHIIMMDRRQLLVMESVDEVIDAAIEYRTRVMSGAHLRTDATLPV